jgi:hypothetical protein
MSERCDPGAPARAHGADQDIAEQRQTQSTTSSTETVSPPGTTASQSADRLLRDSAQSVTDGGASGGEIRLLAALQPDAYEPERKPAAKWPGFRVSSFDRLVESTRIAGASGGTIREPPFGDTGERSRPLRCQKSPDAAVLIPDDMFRQPRR